MIRAATRRGLCWLVALLVGLLLAPAPAAAQSTRAYGDITIQVIEPADAETQHGYMAHQFIVTNRSTTEAHTVRLTLPMDSIRSAGISRISRTAQVAPGATVAMDLLQPPLAVYGNSVEVRIDGNQEDDPLELPRASAPHGQSLSDRTRRSYRSDDSYVLVSESLTRKDITRGASSRVEEVPWALAVERWPNTWLAYSRFDAVAVTAEEIDRMRPSTRDALIRYAECGGSLMVVGAWTPPEAWADTGHTTPPSAGDQPPMAFYNAMLGYAIITTPEAAGSGLGSRFFDNVRNTQRRLADMQSPQQAHRDFPILERLRLPLRTLVVTLLLFCVLIGPVNLLLLRKWNRRIWMWWTVPAMSLVM